MRRWTIFLDFGALCGLALTTWGFWDLGSRLGLGPALGLLWAGAWLLAIACWVARSIAPRRR